MEEQVKLAIITVDESRAIKKALIRAAFPDLDEVFPTWYDCRTEDGRAAALERFGWLGGRGWVPKQGEAGIWYSQLSGWEYARDNNEHLLMIEDDALVVHDVQEQLLSLMREVPDDYGFFSLFRTPNQDGDYQWYWLTEPGIREVPKSRRYDKKGAWADIGQPNVCRAWQGYSCVANVVSPLGASIMIEEARARGMYQPVDCYMYELGRAELLGMYSQKPKSRRLVDVDWDAPSTIAQTEKMP